MTLKGDNIVVQEVEGISEKQQDAISNFLQGAVYCWCKNKPKVRFALRDLMGGDNFYWEGTPLIVLYEKHSNANDTDPVRSAGIDAGWFLKKVLADDKRLFETMKVDGRRTYLWIRENE